MAEVRCPTARAEAGDLLFGWPAGVPSEGCTCPGPKTHRFQFAAEARRALQLPMKIATALTVLSTAANWWVVRRAVRRARAREQKVVDRG